VLEEQRYLDANIEKGYWKIQVSYTNRQLEPKLTHLIWRDGHASR
jgi:hypothetical protein